MVDLADDADNGDSQILDYEFDSYDFAPWNDIGKTTKSREA
jgi:hypothetical protein